MAKLVILLAEGGALQYRQFHTIPVDLFIFMWLIALPLDYCLINCITTTNFFLRVCGYSDKLNRLH